jgi:hypothetical protein
MKKLVLILLIVNLSLTVGAQPEEELNIFPTHMLFYHQQTDTLWSSAESLTDFLKIYNEYENARTKLALRDQQFMDTYTSGSINEVAADGLSKKWLKNDITLCKLRKNYFKKLTKESSSSMASKFILFGKTPVYPASKQHTAYEPWNVSRGNTP